MAKSAENEGRNSGVMIASLRTRSSLRAPGVQSQNNDAIARGTAKILTLRSIRI